MNMKTCPKCNGKGYIAGFGYRDGGICYDCKGTGKVKGKETIKTNTQTKKEIQDKRVYSFLVLEDDQWIKHNVGKFIGLENATKKAEEYSRQINKQVKLIELFRK